MIVSIWRLHNRYAILRMNEIIKIISDKTIKSKNSVIYMIYLPYETYGKTLLQS